MASLLSYLYILYDIKKTKVNVKDVVVWILLSILLIFFSVFPSIISELSLLIDFQVTSNFIFFMSIVLLFFLNFRMSVKNSMLEKKVKTLIQEIAISEVREQLQEGNKDEA